jgi:plastocyanin
VKTNLLFLAPLLAATALAAGCGGGSDTPSSASSSKDGGAYSYDKPAAVSETAKASETAEAGAGAVVKLTNTTFAPQSVDVKVGDTVTFVNGDPVPHTATADDGSFDSKALDQGAKFSFTASKVGKISYVCEFHPGMTGTINVT